MYEHKNHLLRGFTATYQIDRLVYFEEYDAPDLAIAREKEIKGWLRRKKIALIEAMNPAWKDLAASPDSEPDHSEPTIRDSSLRRLRSE